MNHESSAVQLGPTDREATEVSKDTRRFALSLWLFAGHCEPMTRCFMVGWVADWREKLELGPETLSEGEIQGCFQMFPDVF